MAINSQSHGEHAQTLRLWMRLLTSTQLIQKQVRNHLREQFDTTLPRFELMAQLQRNSDGLKMSELSRRMRVTGGNVTGITDQLVAHGLVERLGVDGDRRAYRVRLTAPGRQAFEEMSRHHDDWIRSAFDLLSAKEIDTLFIILSKLKMHE